MPTEASLTGAFLKKLRILYGGAWAYKINDRSTAGVPDVLVCYQSRGIFIEFKKHPYTVKEIQRITHLQIQHAGMLLWIVVFFPDRIEVRKAGSDFVSSYRAVEAAICHVMETL